MKKTLFLSTSLFVAMSLWSCGGSKSNENAEATENAEEMAEPEEDNTINGLEPGAQYQTSFNGFEYDITLYKDGSSTSTQGGDGSWSMESIHDKPFVVVYLNSSTGKLYIDDEQNIHQNSASAKGYKLERINYIPADAKGMIVGKKYTIPDYRWNKDAYITLNEDGTVTSEFNDGSLRYTNWQRVDVDGKEWTIIYWQNIYESIKYETQETITNEENGGYLVSPSLEYYTFSNDDKKIKYLSGELTLNDNWQINREGRLVEE